MKKRYILILILLLTVGFASINTVLDLKGNVSIGFKEDDFNVEISKVVIDNGSIPFTLSEDKQSFTFTGTGNNKIEYRITNKSYQYDANINIICEPSENVIINQVGEVVAQSKKSETIESTNSGLVTCRIDIDKISKTEIAEKMCEYDVGQTWEFNYTGSEQEFVVPCDGEYKLETWGAQGGSTYGYGGYGAYSSGQISFEKNSTVFINVGNQPQGINKAFNDSTEGILNPTWDWQMAAGGGATHMAFGTGLLYNLENNKENIIIVSGAGAGGATYESIRIQGGHAGGIKGGSGSYRRQGEKFTIYYIAAGGAQTSGGTSAGFTVEPLGSFGRGSTSGSGWYGGGRASTTNGCVYTGGGGSSYIANPLLKNKVMYCYNCTASNEESTKTISTTCTSSTPTANCAKQGHGYAKITYLG